MKMLVAIANYGTKSRVYLERLLAEYRSLPHQVDVVVLSDIPKDLGPDVEVRVGLPAKDPWSLPFGHKQLFADRLEDYDLFLYSEDDMLIGQRQIEAFLEVTPALPEDRIAGFLRYEQDATGRRYCPEIHAYCHWEPRSVRQYGSDVFAYLTNEHAAAYVLTREQLRRAIASGGFLVPPHQGFYDLLCSAATDPYTQCGFTRVLCLTRLEDFLIHHLGDKYVNKLGLAFDQVQEQTSTLLRCLQGRQTSEELLPAPPSKPPSCHWSKSYYEPIREDVLAVVPREAKTVLSIGCGAGATEGALAARGVQVVAVPLDAVIAETARVTGIELMPPDFQKAFLLLQGRCFDAILLVDVLPYVPDPPALLAQSGCLLAERGTLVATAPNFGFLGYRANGSAGRRLRGAADSFATFGVHRTTLRLVARWIRRSGLRVGRVKYDERSRFRWLLQVSGRLAGPCLSRTVVITATSPRSATDMAGYHGAASGRISDPSTPPGGACRRVGQESAGWNTDDKPKGRR
jgi:2-polyprenyl-3-methyl-5-hydroxy-6-metoxy-1,4-benzoquinol methylase